MAELPTQQITELIKRQTSPELIHEAANLAYKLIEVYKKLKPGEDALRFFDQWLDSQEAKQWVNTRILNKSFFSQNAEIPNNIQTQLKKIWGQILAITSGLNQKKENPAKPSGPKIKFGDELPEPKIKFGDENSVQPKVDTPVQPTQPRQEREQERRLIKLPNRNIDHLAKFLETNSSEGSECVPLSYAYLRILAQPELDDRNKQQLINQILEEKKRKYGDRLISRNELISEYQNPDQAEHSINTISADEITGINILDKIITVLQRKNGEFLYNSFYGNLIEVKNAKKTCIVFNTETPLTGEIIFVANNNPYREKIRGKKPEVGENFTMAGKHALLAVDYEQAGNEHFLYIVDPMTGCVVKVNIREFVRKNQQFINNQTKKYQEANMTPPNFTDIVFSWGIASIP